MIEPEPCKGARLSASAFEFSEAGKESGETHFCSYAPREGEVLGCDF